MDMGDKKSRYAGTGSYKLFGVLNVTSPRQVRSSMRLESILEGHMKAT